MLRPFLFLLLLAAPLASADAAAPAQEPDIAGIWNVTELDPLFGRSDDAIGKFEYDLIIKRDPAGYRITIPRTGARFRPARVKNGVLITRGAHPDRGATGLELRFYGTRIEGEIRYGDGARKLAGRRDPQQLVDTALAQEQRAQAAAARHDADIARLEAALDAERQRTLALAQALEQAEAARQLSESRLATALNDLAVLRRARPRAPAPKPVAKAVTPPPLPEQKPEPRTDESRPAIALIEPPLAEGTTETDSPRPAALEIVARIESETALMSLRINERPAKVDESGLFRLPAGLPEEGGEVRVVAIDVNGGRSERRFTVHRAAPPPKRAAIRDDTDACYELGVATDPPAALALDACREAVRRDPDAALNHYHLGVVLSRLGQHNAAVRAYREAAARWTR